MRKIFSLPLLICFVLVFFLFEFASAQKMPRNFNFVFTFGNSERPLNKRSELDTKKNTYREDLVDTLITIKLKLLKKEKQKIFEELMKMDFVSYPEKYSYHISHNKDEFISSGTPCTGYMLTITYGDSIKTVRWNDCIEGTTKDEKHAALMKLDKLIWESIYTKESYKNLPKPRRMYG